MKPKEAAMEFYGCHAENSVLTGRGVVHEPRCFLNGYETNACDDLAALLAARDAEVRKEPCVRCYSNTDAALKARAEFAEAALAKAREILLWLRKTEPMHDRAADCIDAFLAKGDAK